MKPSETAELLALIAVLDNRKIDELTVAAWHQLIGDLRYDYTVRAVEQHYATNTDWLMPAHIRTLAHDIAAADHAAPPGTPALEQATPVPMPEQLRDQVDELFALPKDRDRSPRRWAGLRRARPDPEVDERRMAAARAEVAAVAERLETPERPDGETSPAGAT